MKNGESKQLSPQTTQRGRYITSEGNYHDNKLCKISLGVASCEAIINGKKNIPEKVYRPTENEFVKVKKKTQGIKTIRK